MTIAGCADTNWRAVLNDPTRLSPEIHAHLETENAYINAVMAPTRALENILYDELRARITDNDMSVPDRDGGFAYYARQLANAQYPTFCRCPETLKLPRAVPQRVGGS